ncbi:MAG TPA: prolyl oligopeptidase family serine peptidase [Thermoanaerobaculia bacterium]|nr:prolyl oligopeptidase family serine peptidase [Thermoanaerobaculia bacterium]
MIFIKRTVQVQGFDTTYRVFEPRDAKPPLPAILFLHGAGESGSDGLAQTTVGLGPALKRTPIDALVVFPQASRGYGWRGFNLAAAIAALDDVEEHYDVDRDRVSVTGISMGGYGTWLAALQQPARFACAVPVCGGLDRHATTLTPTQAAQRIAHIPQWVFHGDADNVIPVEESRTMVSALRAAGADVRYTEYAGVRHNSWDRAYAEPELMPWLLGQRRVAP